MSGQNSLYLLVNFEKYRDAKIDLLSAQSGILRGRESIRKIVELRHSERVYKTKIANALIKLRLNIKRLVERLPKTRGRRVNPVEHKSSGKKVMVRHQEEAISPIREELDIINQKLIELGA